MLEGSIAEDRCGGGGGTSSSNLNFRRQPWLAQATCYQADDLLDRTSLMSIMSGNKNGKSNSGGGSGAGGAGGTGGGNDTLGNKVKTWFFTTSLNDKSAGGLSSTGLGMSSGSGSGSGSSSSSSSPSSGPMMLSMGGGRGVTSRSGNDLRGMNVWMPQSL